MNTFTYAALFLLALVTLTSARHSEEEGYGYGGRREDRWCCLRFAARLVALEAKLNKTIAQVAALNNTSSNNSNICNSVSNCSAIIQLSQPRCTPAATSLGAKMVNGKCLSVEGSDAVNSSRRNFGGAQSDCASKGGSLAQPSYTDLAFWSNLSSIFPTNVSGLSVNGMYVGIISASGGFYSYVSGGSVPSSAPVWVGAPISTAVNRAAFVRTNSSQPNTWLNPGTAGDGLGTAANGLRGYVCQYPIY